MLPLEQQFHVARISISDHMNVLNLASLISLRRSSEATDIVYCIILPIAHDSWLRAKICYHNTSTKVLTLYHTI